MAQDYWLKYFNESGSRSEDDQEMVGRTKGGEAISEEKWQKTLDYILDIVDPGEEERIIELCCGNGLILGELAKQCKEAVGIDFSAALLERFRNSAHFRENIEIRLEDVTKADFEDAEFDKIVIYFSLQHFSEVEVVELMEKCVRGTRPGGKIFIGDIPDLDKKWTYIDQPEYRADYFKRLKEGNPKTGNWFQRDFFRALGDYLPDVRIEVLDQPDYQLNAHYRFDVVMDRLPGRKEK